MSTQATQGRDTQAFSAHDNAKIGGQFGVVNGDIHIYDVGASATVEERFTAALNLLDGRMPRRAEELIREAVEAGYRSHKVAYYWSLAILSDRSFDHLDQAEFSALQHASALVDSSRQDEWLAALNVITQIINCLLQQEQQGLLAEDDLDNAIRAYESLPEKRRDELDRHLGQIRAGALQDRLDAKYADQVTRRRMAGDRKNRAWKFFMPTPSEPLAPEMDEPQIGQLAQVAAIAGAAVAGAALLAGFFAALMSAPLLGLLALSCVGGGCYLLATGGRAFLVARERVAVDDQRYGANPARTPFTAPAPVSPQPPQDDYEWGESDKADEEQRAKLRRMDVFRSTVEPFVNFCFDQENPDGSKKRDAWRKATAGLRTRLVLQPHLAVDEALLSPVVAAAGSGLVAASPV